MDSHYLPYFTDRRRDGTQLAACQSWVTMADHSTEPTCPACRAWLEEDASNLQTLLDTPVLPTSALRDATDRLVRENAELMGRHARGGRR